MSAFLRGPPTPSYSFFSWQFLAEIFVKYAERSSANFFIPSSNACVIYKDNKNSVFLNFFFYKLKKHWK